MLTFTVPQMAKICAVTPKTIYLWIGEGAPVVKRGKRGRGSKTLIPGAEFVAWVFARQVPQRTLDAERARLARAQADRTEIEVAALQAALISSESELATWRAIRSKVLRKCWRVAGRVAERLGPDAKPIVRLFTNEAVAEIRAARTAPRPPKPAQSGRGQG